MRTKDYVRLFISFIFLCFCTLLPQQTIFAGSFTEGYLTYTENEDGTLTITGYDRSKHEEPYDLQIDNQVNGKTVSAIADKVFQKQEFGTVFIDNDIAIGDYAFEKASFSYNLTLGRDNSGTIRIGKYAFASAAFSDVSFKANVWIGDYAFFHGAPNKILQTDSFTTYIGKSAFEQSGYESGLNFSGLSFIGENAFHLCEGMESFTISPTLKTMYASSLPYSIYTKDMGNLLNVYIDDDVTDVSAFGLGGNPIAVYHVSAKSPILSYLAENNCLFCITETDNPDDVYPAPMPNQIIFGDNYTLKVTGESTASLIQYNYDGESLCIDDITEFDYHGYPLTVNEINYTAFKIENCPYVTEVIYGKTISKIASGTFIHNPDITKITLSDAITEIERGAIMNIASLTIEIPAGITDVSNYHFENMTHIIFLVSENSPVIQQLVNMNLIFQLPGQSPVTPDSPKYPEKTNPGSSTEDVPTTTEPDKPDSPVTEDSTSNTQTTETPTIPSSGGSTSNSPTNARPSKGKVITVKSLRYLVTGKTTVSFLRPKNKQTTKITIPSFIKYKNYKFNVTKISKKACYKCTRLKTVTIGGNVTSIGDYAFARCSQLKKITFGKKVKKLGKRVLYYDKRLENIKFQGTKLQSIGKQTFRKVPKTVSIIVPNSKVTKYKRIINNAK